MSTSSAIQASYRKQSLGERISISRLLPSPWIVLTLLLVCVVLLRLPASFFPKELDPDESQGLSNAMKFAVDPRPFIAVDGGSWGPLNSYLLSIFIVMGFKASFVLAHMLATVLACLQVLIGYLTLRRIGSEIDRGPWWTVASLLLWPRYPSKFSQLCRRALSFRPVNAGLLCFCSLAG